MLKIIFFAEWAEEKERPLTRKKKQPEVLFIALDVTDFFIGQKQELNKVSSYSGNRKQ